MKTTFFKSVSLLLGFLLVNVNSMSASVGDKFDKFVLSEFSNSLGGFYIIAGIVIASLVLYVIVNHFNKEEEKRTVHHGSHFTHHKRHHHTHRVIKKTS
ncbi:MAG: hypothetical protein H0W61_04465 [Bacteroidetes bacterium]|nr:hypothetical protein [Bacteroidota bacterium]